MSEVHKDIVALKEATREAHEAIKDIRLLIKSMSTIKDELLDVAQTVFDERMETQTKEHLEAYSSTIEKHIERATESVYDRFDTLARVMLGKGTEVDLEKVVAGAAEDGKIIRQQG